MNSRLIVAAIVKRGDKYLLGRKPKDVAPYPNTWHLLGGGVNLEDETLEEAIRREVMEEAGIKLGNLDRVWFDDDYEPNKHGEQTHYVFVVFMGEYKSGKLSANDDIKELRWFSKKELNDIPIPRTSVKLFEKLKII